MNTKKMETTKQVLDIGLLVIGLLAALFAMLSYMYGSKIDSARKIEEEKLRGKIAESNATAQKAKKEAANALSSAASTKERAEKLELQAQEQKERAAKAEKQLLELKEKMKPRSIEFEKMKLLIEKLKIGRGKNINITSPLGNGEAALYAEQIKYIFESAGWKVTDGIGFSTITGIGLHIFSKTNNDIDADMIVKTFKSYDININFQFEKEMDLQIYVGSKGNN